MESNSRLAFSRVVFRSAAFHWRSHVLLALSFAIVVGVLSGALIVGWSLQYTLQRTLTSRLGATVEVVTLQRPASAQLAARLGVAQATQLRATVADENESKPPVAAIVWAVDETARPPGWDVGELASDEVIINEAMARDLGVQRGQVLIARVDVSQTTPAGGLFGYRELKHTTRLHRLRIARVVAAGGWGDFSLAQTQIAPRNLFVSSKLLGTASGPNIILSSTAGSLTQSRLARAVTLSDLRLRLRDVASGGKLIQNEDIIFSDGQQRAIAQAAPEANAYGVYIAKTLRAGEKHVSYGIIADSGSLAADEIIVNDWVAKDLNVKAGDAVALETLIAQDDGTYRSELYPLRVREIGRVGEGLFVPETMTEFAGLTSASRMDKWDAPFPVEISQVTKRDEDYWERHRATPKAIVSRELLAKMWHASGYRGLAPVTGFMLPELTEQGESAIRTAIVAADPQWHAIDAREAAKRAGRGSADFSMLFVGMSAFLIVSAIVAAAGIARVAAQERLGDAGLTGAVGIPRRRWLGLMLAEYSMAIAPGVLAGLVGGVLYARGLLWMFYALSERVWDLPPLEIDARPGILVAMGVGVALMTLGLAVWQMRADLKRPVRELMASVRGSGGYKIARGSGVWLGLGIVVAAIMVMLVLSRLRVISPIAGFFTVATMTIVAAHLILRLVSNAKASGPVPLNGWRLCMRLLQSEPRRAQLTLAMFMIGTFVLCAVALFRGAAADAGSMDRDGPAGGFALRVISPLTHRTSLETAQGQKSTGLALPAGTKVFSLLTSAGTEGGCLNLAVPGEMQLLGVPSSLVERGGFDVRTKSKVGNPWTLLQDSSQDPIAVFGDEETMQWIEHHQLGDVFTMPVGGQTRQFRLAGLIRGGLFSGQLLMSADNFRRLLPDSGYGMHLVETGGHDVSAVQTEIFKLADAGMICEQTGVIIASVQSVQRLYMTLFLALGGLGLLLGSVGALVLMVRDANQRRGDLSLLSAIGLSDGQVARVLLLWHVIPVCGGLVAGLSAAVLGYSAMNRPMGLRQSVLIGTGVLVITLILMAAFAHALRPRQISEALRRAA